MHYLKISVGFSCSRTKVVLSLPSVLPIWIDPCSCSGPQEALSGRDIGRWLTKITG
jgi:hypothetical protein